MIRSPPPKNVAFEEFKSERGNEINRIWNENKGRFFVNQFLRTFYF